LDRAGAPPALPAGMADVHATYVGWDITDAGVATLYLVMVVGIICALICWWLFGRLWPSAESVSASFTLFSLFEATACGFAGIAHHILATHYWEHEAMSRQWGHAHAGWMVPYAAAVALRPVASAACLGTAFSFAECGVGWIRATKWAGVVVAIVELALARIDVDRTGTWSLYWGALTAVAGCCVLFSAGLHMPGFVVCGIGYFVRSISYLVVFILPKVCGTESVHVVNTNTGTMYQVVPNTAETWCPKHLHHIAWFHSLIAVSIPFIFVGVLIKLNSDRQLAYTSMMLPAYQKATTRWWDS